MEQTHGFGGAHAHIYFRVLQEKRERSADDISRDDVQVFLAHVAQNKT